mmetsp:Transcript_8628/g.16705  ORF Transcript_8628/g.16705 Transcript_8628/m.16705 type:complete len:677 (-) Transcript_8628:128-2158(-)
MQAETDLKEISLSEVAKHNTKDDLWLAVDGYVYDLSDFLSRHPGGTAPKTYAGKDASEVFHRIHPKGTIEAHKKLIIGRLDGSEGAGLRGATSEESKPGNSYYNVAQDTEGYDKRRAGEAGREFGDLMANEGELSNIPYIIVVMYAALAFWGYLAHLGTGCSPWTVFMYYLAGMSAFYLWHRLAHSTWTGEMHEIHMEHHLIRFPPSDFYGSAELYAEMYPNGKPTIWDLMDLTKTTNVADGTALSSEGVGLDASKTPAGKKHTPLAHEGPLLLFLFLILVGGWLICGTKLSTLLYVFILYFVVATAGNALHMSFHVRGFHLEKYAWYRELRTLHYIHHLGDMKSNLAMLNMGMDGFFSSLAISDPNPAQAGSPASSSSAADSTEGFYSSLASATDAKTLPDGVTKDLIRSSAKHAGAVAAILGLDLPLDVKEKRRTQVPPEKRGYQTVLLRLLITYFAVGMWFKTEAMVGDDAWVAGGVDQDPAAQWGSVDILHTLLTPLGATLSVMGLVKPLCALSASVSDLSVLVMIGVSVLGPTYRPLLATTLVMLMRLVVRVLGGCYAVMHVPSSSWNLPEGWPTLFVQRGPAANQFFSARVALATVVAMELLSVTLYTRKDKKIKALAATGATLYIAFNVVLTLALRASWSFDVAIALLLARYSTIAAHRLSVFVDTFMP